MLTLGGISKSFGGLKAVADVGFTAEKGAITALIGPNGAGKTTLFAIAAGFIAPDTGTIGFDGRPIRGLPPHRIAALGLVRTFQIVQPFAQLTVRENVAVGAHLHIAGRRAALARAGEVAAFVGMGDQLDKPAASLTIAGRKRLELARALAASPRFLLLDEVMAGLNPREIEDIVAVIRRIRDRGVTVLLIEHVMHAVVSLAERCLVLNNGALIADGTPAQIGNDPRVVEAYLGHGAAARLLRGAAHA